MASAIVRTSLRSALRGGSKRSFSSGASAEEEAREAAKWEKITYVGIVACSILAFVNLSKGHPHFEEPPPYPYLHIRNKEFPWGPDGLFEVKEHHSSIKANTAYCGG
ncbi:cytochrome c oxidase subunit 6a, mitochondrial-like [Bidens hawaiensis]|uniref:cytochrome c oxidase subunit 6a, mitochondrial-like n=1 Tax=Bidens hawaiensis TaxID=980011 RepID=UPI00404B0CA6